GSVLDVDGPAEVRASVFGTAPIESLRLYCGKKAVRENRPRAFDNLQPSKRIRVSWKGSRIRGRGRRVQWDGAIHVQGPRILSVTTFAFDAPIDGIRAQTNHDVTFASHTTGDTDGIDLILDRADTGRVIFDSK